MYARVAKLADARDLKSRVLNRTYRFNSGPGHHLNPASCITSVRSCRRARCVVNLSGGCVMADFMLKPRLLQLEHRVRDVALVGDVVALEHAGRLVPSDLHGHIL